MTPANLLATTLCVFALAQPVAAAGGHSDHDQHAGHGGRSGHDSHSGHGTADDHRMPVHLAMAPAEHAEAIGAMGSHAYSRELASYDLPDVTLRDQTGTARNLAEVLDHEGPVLLNFVFTSCATICPIMSAVFGQTQEEIAALAPGYRMVSISIDPEYDTPDRLAEYAKLHEARPEWVFLTGRFDDVFAIVTAFDAVFRANNKMYHKPLTFLRERGADEWTRLEGLLSAEELSQEFAVLEGARTQ